MAHDACKLRLGFGCVDGAEVHEHSATGQGEGVDGLIGDNVEAEGPLLGKAGRERRHGDKAGTELLDVTRNGVGVRKDGHLLVDFCDDLVAFGDLLLLGNGVLAGDRLELRGRGSGEGEEEKSEEEVACHDEDLLRGGCRPADILATGRKGWLLDTIHCDTSGGGTSLRLRFCPRLCSRGWK